jgi:hypothetical protein
MNENPFELKPTMGIKIVLTALCAIVGALLTFYLLS